MAEAKQSSQLVVIGSSAGGIQALSTLVGTLTDDFSAPIILAQHLHPEHESHLQEILQRHSPLPVTTVTGHHHLDGGVIFVVPPNRHVEIAHHEVRLSARPKDRPMPSIDHLLTSAAGAYGEDLIAVVLTGAGSDGTAGARDVKAHGGTVIIENPVTSSFPGMPRSLAPTTVDITAELKDIGPLLHQLVTEAMMHPPATPEQDLRRLLGKVRERSGLDFSNYKRGTILRRVQRRVVATGTSDIAAYYTYLDEDPEEFERLISSFLINVTEFFRDPELFEYLQSEGLTQIMERARREGELRIWSAGCSTGEEAYSIAILVNELLGDDIHRVNVRIFGTDLDPAAISFARRGVYPASAVGNIPHEMIERSFVETEDGVEVSQAIRSMVVFGQHDLGQRSPFPRIDLVLCRNVLIYFTSDLQRRALELFAFALRQDGLLIIGKTESIRPLTEHFVPDEPRLKVFHRVKSEILIPPAQMHDVNPISPVDVARRERRLTNPAPVRSATREDSSRSRSSADLDLDTVLSRLPDGVVLIDRNYKVLAMNPAARQHLGIRLPAIDGDLLHLIQDLPLNAVRDAIDRAFEGEESDQKFPLEGARAEEGQSMHLELHYVPVSNSRTPADVDVVLIRIRDVGDSVDIREALQASKERNQHLSDEIHRLENANEELALANMNLHAGNDELQISNEEFKAAAEEVETLNEELQATNEELETLNEELQATIEELNTTNDDLHARSRELEEMAQISEDRRQESDAARDRLGTVLANLPRADAVVVVDEQGDFVLTNSTFRSLFGEAGELLPEIDADVAPGGEDASLRERAARGETFTSRFHVNDKDGTRRKLEASGYPIRADRGRGGVIIVRDLTGI